MAPVLEGQSIGSDQKTVLKGELLIWRTKNEDRDQGTVQLKDSICFKSVQIDLYEISLDPRVKLPSVGAWKKVFQHLSVQINSQEW
jgi:hypothetical protein